MKRESLNLNIMNHNPDNFRITKWQDCGQKLKFFPNIDPILLHLSLVSYQKKRHQQGFCSKNNSIRKKGLSSKHDPFNLLKKHSIKS